MIPDGLDATLVLLRHGESEFIVEGRFQGQAETPLSATGRRQAELAGIRLAQPHRSPALPVPQGAPLLVVHSPLARTAETAAAVGDAYIAEGTPVPLQRDPAFAEIRQGDWEGRLHTEIAERWGDVLAGWRRRPTEVWAPGGESLDEVRTRVRDGVARVLTRLADGRPPGTLDRPQVAGYTSATPPDHPWAIVVGHDGVFKVLLLTLFDLPLERFWMFTLALCGVTVIELRAGQPVLKLHNSTEHLAPLLDEQAETVAEARARSGAL